MDVSKQIFRVIWSAGGIGWDSMKKFDPKDHAQTHVDKHYLT